eukprot:524742-Alexandrium_andersonii.AAC.1
MVPRLMALHTRPGPMVAMEVGRAWTHRATRSRAAGAVNATAASGDAAARTPVTTALAAGAAASERAG